MKKSERLNQELIYLNGKKSFNIRDLMVEFNISKRTAIRDIQELEYMGLSLYTEAGRYGKYNIVSDNILTPIHFNTEEIASIFFAIKAIENLSQTPFDKTYNQIYQKLFAILPENKKDMVDRILDSVKYNSVPTITKELYLRTILNAILNEQLLSIEYAQNNHFETSVYPLNIFFQNGIWFMNGYDIGSKSWKIFRCDCILNCEILTEIMAFSNDLLPFYNRTEAKNNLSIHNNRFHNIEFKCELTKYGKELFLKRNFYEMRLEEYDGKHFLVGNYNSEQLEYLTQYLISFGKQVKILYPDELISKYKLEILEMLNSY